jgi:hypothetical protein
MLKDLTDRCQDMPLFVSDELPHYGTVLGELFHELVPPDPWLALLAPPHGIGNDVNAFYVGDPTGAERAVSSAELP